MFQILIADDEPNIREGVRQFITRRCPEWQGRLATAKKPWQWQNDFYRTAL